MTFILDMVSGKVCEDETLYPAPRQLNAEENSERELHMACPNLQLALVAPAMTEKHASIVPVGLDIAKLLDSTD